MSALFAFLLFFLIAVSVSAGWQKPAVNNSPVSDNPIIREVCRASRDPSTCEALFSSLPPENATVLGAIHSALRLSSQNRDVGREMVQKIIDSSAAKFNLSNTAKTCLELLGYSSYRTAMAGDALSRGAIKDARAWMSASLVYQYDCWSGFRYVNDTSDFVLKTMAFFNTSLIVSSANALAMIANYDVSGDKTDIWTPPKTERDGFWEPTKESSSFVFSGGFPADLKPDVTVCKAGCNYETVQAAVNAAPVNPASGNRFVIWIKSGVYEEMVRVPFEKKNVVFLGDGIGKTIITGSANVAYQGVTTYNSATVGIMGDGFMASGITFQNKAGPDAHQAVAFRSDSDLSVIQNCEFLGNQDTLYAHSLRQYYKSCRIQGNVDFIFGNSAVVFQDCLILVAPRQVNPELGEKNVVTAHGRIDPAQSTGFVFENCVINGTDAYMSLLRSKPSVHKTFLGRPWKEYSRTVYIRCTLELLIVPEGWLIWNGDFALQTLYYGEFENKGRGSDTSQRVKWSSKIPAKHVNYYSVQNFIQGNQWIPASS